MDNYLFVEKGTLEKHNSVKESPATGTVPQTTTTKSPLKRGEQAKVTSLAFQSTPTSTGRPKASGTTRLPEFVHMPTVKFDFGSSKFLSKGSTRRRTDTRESLYKDIIKESQKENIKGSTWSSRNDIEKETVKSDNTLLRNKEEEQVGNRIGSIPALSSNIPAYSSKARFNDKDDSMFSQAASNR